MSAFEWIVIVLLVGILLRSGGGSARLDALTSLLRQLDERLGRMEQHLAEINASTSSTSDDVSAIRVANMPYTSGDPDDPR